MLKKFADYHFSSELNETATLDDLNYEYMKDNPEITQGEMAQSTGLSIDGVKYQIKKLREAGIIKREGGRKSGRWTVLKPKD